MKREIKKWNNIPCTTIMMTLAPMMAIARGWPMGNDMETRIRMVYKYMEVAALLN